MSISIIMPVYNAAEWLEQAVKSIDYGNLIMVDDGSTDGSGELCESLGRTIHTEHVGAAEARNIGIRAARDEFIAFCDADDYYEPGMLRRMESEIVDHDMVIGGFRKFGTWEQVVCDARAASRTKEFLAKYAFKNLQEPRKYQLFSGCWAKLYRSDSICEFPDLTTCEDMAFNFDYFDRCDSVRFMNNVVYNVRKRGSGSLTTTFDQSNKNGLFQFSEGLKVKRRFIEEHCNTLITTQELDAAVENASLYHSLLYFTRICGDDPQKAFKALFP